MAKRRRSGEGSIFQMTNGKWRGFVNLGYRNGKRWRKKITAPTEQEVIKQVAEWTAKVRSGAPLSTGRTTVGDYLHTWLEESVRNSVRWNTYESYADQIDRYVISRIGHLELSKLRAQHIRRCLNDILTCGGTERRVDSPERGKPKPVSARTVKYCRTILNQAFKQAADDGLIERNPVTSVKGPKVEEHDIEPYTPKQARALLEAVEDDRLQGLFTVAVALGMRQGEILGLRWSDVDIEGNRINLRFQLQRVKGEKRFVELKTKKSRRTLKLPMVVANALIKHKRLQHDLKLLTGSRWQEWNLVFPTTIGTPMDQSNLSKHFHKMTSAVGLPQIRFHDIRHTAATLLLIQGVHPRAVMAVLGHSQISLTMNTYSHFIVEEMGGHVAAQMDDILAPESGSCKSEIRSQAPEATTLATGALSRLVQ